MCLTPRIDENVSESGNTLDLRYPVDNCNYCDIDETKNLQLDNSDLVCVQWNTRGLIGKQGELSNFLFNCMGEKKIDVLILSESWITKSSENRVKIPGYVFVRNHTQGEKGGRVGFLISEEIKYILREDLICSLEHFENCTIEIISPKRNILIGSVYQPPNTNEKRFVENFNYYVSKINGDESCTKKDTILGLDHNLDLLKAINI